MAQPSGTQPSGTQPSGTQPSETQPVGTLLREWRQRRRVSQLRLASDADISARHLSFVETGRARPSADLLLRLAEFLDVPLRERNDLLVAAGHAPRYRETQLEELGPVLASLQALLTAHEPCPAVVVDRRWNLLLGNAAVQVFTAGVAPRLLEPPLNVLRLALHPDGMAPRIGNLDEVRHHLLARLTRQALLTGDPALTALAAELAGLPGWAGRRDRRAVRAGRPDPAAHRSRGAELLLDDRDVRRARGHHARRAGDRDVPPGGRADRERTPRVDH